MAYLQIIDNIPTDGNSIVFFKQFGIDVQQSPDLIIPAAEDCIGLLIDWSILQTKPDFIQTCYQSSPIPIIVMHTIADENAVIVALESGADDFLIKPWHPRELQARLTAINRRIVRQQQLNQPQKEIICFENWRVYPGSRQIFHAGQAVNLSTGEFDLLLLLLHHSQKIVGRDEFNQLSKSNAISPLDRRIDVQISRLRQKLEPLPEKPLYIKTIRNYGYMFTPRVVFLQEHELEE